MAEAKSYLLIGRKPGGEEQQLTVKGGHARDVKRAFLEGGGYEVTVAVVEGEPDVQKEQPGKNMAAFPAACLTVIFLGLWTLAIIVALMVAYRVAVGIFDAFGAVGLILLAFASLVAYFFIHALVYFTIENRKTKK